MSDRVAALLLLFCIGGLFWPWAVFASAPLHELHRAQFLISDTPHPPPATTPGRQTRLIPDDWNRSQPGFGGIGWYRFEIHLDAVPQEPWAVYVSRVWMNATVYVNGVPLSTSGDLAKPTPSNWNRPLLFIVPPSLLRSGGNEVQIGVWAYANTRGGLYGAEFAPESLLKARFDRRFFLKVTLNQALLAATLFMAGLIGLLWLRRRKETIYGWFALSALAWAAKTALFLYRDPRIETWVWAWWAHIVNVWAAVLIAIVIHRYFGIRRPTLERAMLGYALAGTVVIPLLDLSATYYFGAAFAAGSFAMVCYAVYCAVSGTVRERQVDQAVLTLGIVAQVGLAVHDWLLNLGILQHQDWYLMHYGAPVLCFILTWLLTSRFVQALNVSEATAEQLAHQVEQKRQELEVSYQRMQELQRRQAVVEERERIMRDLHDGLGGQLVSALALSQNGESQRPAIEQTLRDALDDLRVVIDSLDPIEGDLLVLLGTVRGRLEPRLAQQGLRFEWQVKDIPQIPGFGPDKALHVLRIVQEAIANVLKHAKARTVTIRTGTQPDPNGHVAVFIEVTDDGAGIREERVGGRGLRNMRERAARIGARLDLDSGEHGTTVRLSLPLPDAA